MPIVEEVRKDDIGTVFRVTMYDGSNVLDISSATTKNFVFQNADGIILTRAGVFTIDGIDGKLEYVSIADDLSVAGKWKLQVALVLPSGQWRSNIVNFKVYANL